MKFAAIYCDDLNWAIDLFHDVTKIDTPFTKLDDDLKGLILLFAWRYHQRLQQRQQSKSAVALPDANELLTEADKLGWELRPESQPQSAPTDIPEIESKDIEDDTGDQATVELQETVTPNYVEA